MLDNDPQLAWIAVGVFAAIPAFGLMAWAIAHGLRTALSWWHERPVRKRLETLKRVYWSQKQDSLRRALASEVMLRRRR